MAIQQMLLGIGGASTAQFGDRAIIAGGYSFPNPATGAYSRNIEYYSIATNSGNASDFGDMGVNNEYGGATVSNGNTAVMLGFSDTANAWTHTRYVTISTTGNASQWGTTIVDNMYGGAFVTNTDRAVWCGGQWYPGHPGGIPGCVDCAALSMGAPDNMAIIPTDLSSPGKYSMGYVSGLTRGVMAGGNIGSPPYRKNEIQYINIASPANASDFGDLDANRDETTGIFSSTRGLFCGGYGGSPEVWIQTTHYVDIDTTSNSTPFGSLVRKNKLMSGASNDSRGTLAGGNSEPQSGPEQIQYFSFPSPNNASDFGDLAMGRVYGGGASGD